MTNSQTFLHAMYGHSMLPISSPSPVALHSVKNRFVVYEKGIEDEVDIVAPSTIGGLKSDEYLKLNCHGKVGMLYSAVLGNCAKLSRIFSGQLYGTETDT